MYWKFASNHAFLVVAVLELDRARDALHTVSFHLTALALARCP